MNMNKKQYGFTLIELMISIVLGLLVVAAALAIYLSGQRSLSLQNGMSELQQSSIFGLSLITHDVRHANLNTNTSLTVNPSTAGSGIIFSVGNLPTASLGASMSNVLTAQDSGEGGTTQRSDRLTIQFKPQYRTTATSAISDMTDCEGNAVRYSTTRTEATVVQVYYVAEMLQGTQSYSPKRYGLFCDAGFYVEANPQVQRIGQGQQLLMPDVEAFKVKLGVKNATGELRYMTINQYTAAPTTGDVISVDLGVLARSANPIGTDSKFDNDQTFNLFNDVTGTDYGKVTLKDEQKTDSKYLRHGFSQVVTLRNTAGAL